MPTWKCKGCGCQYAAGLEACPQCGRAADWPVRGRWRRMRGKPGPAENVENGEVTPAGEPLPEIPDADAGQKPARKAAKRAAAGDAPEGQ